MFYLFGLSVALFLFALILVKKQKTRSDYILLIWIGVMVIHMLLFYFDYREISYEYPHLLGVSLPIPILHGMLLYFYTLALIEKDDQISVKKVLIHLIPFFVLVILALPFYVLSGPEKVAIYKRAGEGFEWYKVIQISSFVFFGFAYSIASIIQIRKCRQQLLDNFSNIDKRMLPWLEYLSIGLAVIWLVSAFFSDQIVFGAVVIFVLFIGFFGINQYPVFYSVSLPEPKPVVKELAISDVTQNAIEDSFEKYSKSKLKEDEATSVMIQLQTVMSSQKPFTNADLTLNDLASRINVSPNHLSQVINSLSGKTFYHYINAYRISEFLKLSSQPENRKFTYQGLAQQCGFSSKTTFNKYFKLETGKTPSEYFN